MNNVWDYVKRQSLFSQTLMFFAAAGVLNAFILVFAVEYSTYKYALNNVFRPPLEGIPYLEEAVFIFTFSIWFLKYFALQLLRRLVFAVIKYISNLLTNFDDVVKGYISSSDKISWRYFLNKGFRNGCILLLMHLYFRLNKDALAQLRLRSNGFEGEAIENNDPEEVFRSLNFKKFTLFMLFFILTPVLFVFTGSFNVAAGVIFRSALVMFLIFSFYCYVLNIKYASSTNIVLLFTIGFFSLCVPMTLFFGSVFPSLLSYVGYGGGRVVVVEFEGGEPQTRCLMMRTEDAIFVRRKESSNVVEMKMSERLTITYNYPRQSCDTVLTQ